MLLLDRITAELNASERIVIFPHEAADGDAIGSSFALALILSRMGKKVQVLMEEEIPYIYGFLPGIEFCGAVIAGNGSLSLPGNGNLGLPGSRSLDMAGSRNLDPAGGCVFDLAVALDCGDMERLGSRKEIFGCSPKSVNIDHHLTNTQFAVMNYVDAGSSATGEIIYDLMKRLGQRLDKDIAECLYVAISTDTGGFRYTNTTPLTHRIAADLLEAGIDVAGISQKVFDSTSSGKVKLMGAAIQSLELLENGKIAVMAVSGETIMNMGASEADSDGIINTARNIRGVEVAAMLRETDKDGIKVNLRSNSYVDVSAIAGRYSGGGHKCAAGFTAGGSLEQVKEMLIKDLKEALVNGRDN
jgi:phosphoesterase RecJ-like protein